MLNLYIFIGFLKNLHKYAIFSQWILSPQENNFKEKVNSKIW